MRMDRPLTSTGTSVLVPAGATVAERGVRSRRGGFFGRDDVPGRTESAACAGDVVPSRGLDGSAGEAAPGLLAALACEAGA